MNALNFAGLIGSAAGVAIGLSVARALTIATSQTMEGMFGVSQNARQVEVDASWRIEKASDTQVTRWRWRQ